MEIKKILQTSLSAIAIAAPMSMASASPIVSADFSSLQAGAKFELFGGGTYGSGAQPEAGLRVGGNHGMDQQSDAGQSWQWQARDYGVVPADVVALASDDSTSVVCGAWYKNEWNVGKLAGKRCNYAWGGYEYIAMDYLFLTGHDINWIDFNNQMKIPKDAIYLGSKDTNISYVCGAEFNGFYVVGKADLNSCTIGWEDKEYIFSEYKLAIAK